MALECVSGIAFVVRAPTAHGRWVEHMLPADLAQGLRLKLLQYALFELPGELTSHGMHPSCPSRKDGFRYLLVYFQGCTPSDTS